MIVHNKITQENILTNMKRFILSWIVVCIFQRKRYKATLVTTKVIKIFNFSIRMRGRNNKRKYCGKDVNARCAQRNTDSGHVRDNW